jgi:enoyl-CoA hydratase/carnithine racemase
METGTNDILYERKGAAAWVTFNRPDSRNAMTFEMYDLLGKICDEVENDPDVRVLVLRGAGDKAFVAGTDISQFQTFTDPQHALEYEERVGGVISRLETVPKPTIAVIQGYAVGGGAAISLASDMRIGTPNAKIGMPIARTLGNCLAMAAYARLVDLVGPARTKEVIYTARMIEAKEAKSMGLLNQIVEPDELDDYVTNLVEKISNHAPITIQVTKESVQKILESRRPPRDEELLLRAYMSEDFKEGVRAFLEKRKPNWQGK